MLFSLILITITDYYDKQSRHEFMKGVLHVVAHEAFPVDLRISQPSLQPSTLILLWD